MKIDFFVKKGCGPPYTYPAWGQPGSQPPYCIWSSATDGDGMQMLAAYTYVEGSTTLNGDDYTTFMENLVLLCEIEYAKQTGGG